jgi:hypothetical protein
MNMSILWWNDGCLFKWCLEAWVHDHVDFMMKWWLSFKWCLKAWIHYHFHFHHEMMVALHMIFRRLDSWTCRFYHEMMVSLKWCLIMTVLGSLFTISLWWLVGKNFGVLFEWPGFPTAVIPWVKFLSSSFYWCHDVAVCFSKLGACEQWLDQLCRRHILNWPFKTGYVS